jgi:hypothetical protein
MTPDDIVAEPRPLELDDVAATLRFAADAADAVADREIRLQPTVCGSSSTRTAHRDLLNCCMKHATRAERDGLTTPAGRFSDSQKLVTA